MNYVIIIEFAYKIQFKMFSFMIRLTVVDKLLLINIVD